jgi:hypothetical protein
MFEALASVVSNVDPALLTDAALLGGFEELVELEARVRAAQAAWLVVIDAREATVGECGRATRSWLVEELRMAPGAAGRRLRLARALSGLPAVAAALGAGEISAEHAEVIAAGARQLPPAQADTFGAALLEAARQTGPGQVAALADAVAERLGCHDARDAAAARRLAERAVGLDVTFAGYASLSGTLTPETAATLRLALDAASPRVGPDDDRSVRARRHDGLAEIASFYLAHATDLPPETGERPRLVVTIGYDPLRRALDASSATLDTGTAISPATARRLACDAELIPAVLGGRGEVLDLGRATRIFPTAIRRAAAIRDQHRCAFPNCRRPIRELHHLHWWTHGGTTTLDNAAWLCTFHHWLTHDRGWTIRRNPDHTYTWTDPHGRDHPHRQTEAA